MTRRLEVAVGVVMRPDGSVLLGQRVPGKPYAGWWEFPGGKLEAGETVAQALARELHEELGLEVAASHPWLVREFEYPHAHVRLHLRRIFGQWGDFSGEPQSREGQAFAWQSSATTQLSPLLPATIPALGWLRLAPVLTTWDPGEGASAAERASAGRAAVLRDCAEHTMVEATLGAGIAGLAALRVLDLPALSGRVLETVFQQARAATEAMGGRLLVSSRHPLAMAQAAGGLLLQTEDLRRASVRPASACCGARCDNTDDIARAAELELDFVVSAVHDTTTRLPLYLADARVSLREAITGGAHGVTWD